MSCVIFRTGPGAPTTLSRVAPTPHTTTLPPPHRVFTLQRNSSSHRSESEKFTSRFFIGLWRRRSCRRVRSRSGITRDKTRDTSGGTRCDDTVAVGHSGRTHMASWLTGAARDLSRGSHTTRQYHAQLWRHTESHTVQCTRRVTTGTQDRLRESVVRPLSRFTAPLTHHDRGDAHIHKTPCTNTHAHTHTQLQLLALHLLDCTKSPCSGALMLTAVAPSSSLWPKRAPKCQRVK